MPKGDSTSTTVGTGFKPDPSSATFTFDNEPVTLSDGQAEVTDSAVGLVTETELQSERGYGDLNGDGKDDVVVFLTQSGGGSGTFVYAAAYVSGPVGYKGTNAIFLGDRIAPQSASISNKTATVNYLDRKDDEPFAAEPTVSVSQQFVYKNSELVEK